ncbi:MAG: BrnT family toxin [Acidobacteria bacterium]|nr:BrnT family toxin [Acidobacteriota bacterium]
MEFEYDPPKSASNYLKHGIDFEEGQNLWKDGRGVEIKVGSSAEQRSVFIARYRDKHWTAVFTYRNDRIRLISIRRARLKEIMLYDNR